MLGNGLIAAEHYEDALPVYEAELSMRRRFGDSEDHILIAQGNLANTYNELGRLDEALRVRQEVYSGHLKLNGEENYDTLREAFNYAASLVLLKRFKEARALMRKTVPVARRVHGDNDRLTLKMRWNYAEARYQDPGATLDNLREAVSTLEDTERTARRVLGGAHPVTTWIGENLQAARPALRAHEPS